VIDRGKKFSLEDFCNAKGTANSKIDLIKKGLNRHNGWDECYLVVQAGSLGWGLGLGEIGVKAH